MGYVRRFATTGTMELRQDIKRETELLYIHDIVNLIENHKIPKSMVLNLDLTPVKYISCDKTTFAKPRMLENLALQYSCKAEHELSSLQRCFR